MSLSRLVGMGSKWQIDGLEEDIIEVDSDRSERE